MSYVRSELALPSLHTPHVGASAALASLWSAIAASLRSRWVYQQTRAELEGSSERVLLDIGADRGIEEFARRAAGL